MDAARTTLEHTRALAWLPTGNRLDDATFAHRHRMVATVLVAAGVVVAGLAVSGGAGHDALVAVGLVVGSAGLLSSTGPRRVRAVLTALGLVVLASLAVHLTGTIEAHFLFFILVPLIAFYEDWLPFVVTVALVTAHHVVGGLLWPEQVFNHAAALAAPLRWSAIHVGLLSLMVLTTLVHWRLHELARVRNDELVATLSAQVRRDPLTGCANRRALDERLHEELERAARSRRYTAVLSLDLDGFKQLNDTYGHVVGDLVLIELAQRLRATCRASDTVARTGGDEFVLVLPDSDEARARRVAARLLVAVARPLADAPDTPVGASIGVVVADADATPEQLLELADEAMYEAKRRGRGIAVVAGQAAPDGPTGTGVVPADARAWARYVQEVRAEIAARKRDGDFAGGARAPETVHRTLMSLLAAIEQLPPGPAARLSLPDVRSLEEFVFHHGAVQAWLDDLVEAGRLTTIRSTGAQRFWDALYRVVELGGTQGGREPSASRQFAR